MADQPDLKTLLENVEEFVNDENQIVTYEWLSQSLGIHVGLAKDVLQKYVDRSRKTADPSLRIVYSLGGYIGKNLKLLLISEDSLSKTKSTFDKTLYSHVYSIQKRGLEDYETIYNANHEKFKSNTNLCNEFSGITQPNLKQRPAQVQEMMVQAPQQPAKITKQESNGWIKTGPGTEVKNKEKEKLEVKDIKEESSDSKGQQKENSKPGEKKAVMNKGGISALFAKQQSKPPVEKKPVEEEEKKATNKRMVREPSSDEADEEKSSKDVKRFKLSSAPAKEVPPNPTNVPKTKPLKTKQQASKKKATSQQKQRKRIQQVSDSESNDGEDSAEELERIGSPEVPVAAVIVSDDEEIPPTPQRTSGEAKKKGRKLVTKHHMDEDGFIVTSKVMEEVEESEDEVPKGSTKPESKPAEPIKVETAPKKPSPPPKNKQASIMNFFSRK